MLMVNLFPGGTQNKLIEVRNELPQNGDTNSYKNTNQIFMEIDLLQKPWEKEILKPVIHRKKINWTPEMIEKLIHEFPYRYNKELAKDLGISWRSLVRKARDLKIEKESGFLEKRRDEITKMATEAHPPNSHKGDKGWSIPGGEKFRFKKGNIPPTKNNPDLIHIIHQKRNDTIRIERLRLKYGLSQKTKLNLKSF